MQTLRISLMVLGVTLSTTILSTPGAAQPKAREWSIEKTPLLSIGVASGDSTKEFHRAETALRLSTGEIVVADAGASRLRWFGPDGSHIRSIGRRGQGPEDFSRQMILIAGSGDTILVHDRSKRIQYFTGAGAFVRTETGVTTDRSLTVYDRSLIVSLAPSVRIDAVRRALLRIPSGKEGGLRIVRVDATGHLWVSEASDQGVVSVHDSLGAPVGRLAVPRGFELLQPFDTLVLGRFRGDDDVEQIQLRRLARGGSNAALNARPSGRQGYDYAAELAVSRAVVAQMNAVARNMLTIQEGYAAGHGGRYASTPDSLGVAALVGTTGIQTTFISAGDRSYWFIVGHPSTRIVCVYGIGPAVPTGYTGSCG